MEVVSGALSSAFMPVSFWKREMNFWISGSMLSLEDVLLDCCCCCCCDPEASPGAGVFGGDGVAQSQPIVSTFAGSVGVYVGVFGVVFDGAVCPLPRWWYVGGIGSGDFTSAAAAVSSTTYEGRGVREVEREGERGKAGSSSTDQSRAFTSDEDFHWKDSRLDWAGGAWRAEPDARVGSSLRP